MSIINPSNTLKKLINNGHIKNESTIVTQTVNGAVPDSTSIFAYEKLANANSVNRAHMTKNSQVVLDDDELRELRQILAAGKIYSLSKKEASLGDNSLERAKAAGRIEGY